MKGLLPNSEGNSLSESYNCLETICLNNNLTKLHEEIDTSTIIVIDF